MAALVQFANNWLLLLLLLSSKKSLALYMKKTPVFLVFLLFISASTKLWSQQVTEQAFLPHELYQGTSFLIKLDNDKFSTKRLDQDRDYTNGIAFMFNSEQVNGSPFHKLNGKILNKTWELFHPNRRAEESLLIPLAGSVNLWGLTYTPRNITETAVIYDDRPFASVQALEAIVRFKDPKLNRVHSLGISYGVIATPAAEWAQRIIHTIGHIRPLPEGWANQISHPWEPTLLISYQRDRIWQSVEFIPNTLFADLRESMAFDLGFRVVASYGLTGRIGYQWGEKDPSNLFFFMRFRPYVIAYDATLQGQFRPSVHSLEAKDVKHMRNEFSLGFGSKWNFGKSSLIAGYGFYRMSPEASYPFHKRSHNWGSFMLGWGF